MSQVVTYTVAKNFRDQLIQLGVKFKPETFQMKTSGVYIPLWEKDIPHNWDGKTAKWYFFYRFANGFPDVKVSDCISYANILGMQLLANLINSVQPHKLVAALKEKQ